MECPQNKRAPEAEEFLLDRSGATPPTSTQRTSTTIGICHSTAWRILHKEVMQPFHVQIVQCLNADEYPRRSDFVGGFLQLNNSEQLILNNMQSPALVLFNGESAFNK